jgi:translation elongation factor EF-Tu-like GTPase
MSNYDELEEFDLLARVYLIETEFGGRQGAVYDGYRGQFFWHINDVNCSDWDASYIFESGMVNPGQESNCKVLLSENLKKYSKGVFPTERQFGIREGSKIIGVGVIIRNRVKNA